MSQNDQLDQAARTAGFVGQVGCMTGLASIIIIGAAFAAGRFLDSWIGTEGLFTILFLLGSFPITLYVIVRISLYALRRAQLNLPPTPADQTEDEKLTEEDSKI